MKTRPYIQQSNLPYNYTYDDNLILKMLVIQLLTKIDCPGFKIRKVPNGGVQGKFV